MFYCPYQEVIFYAPFSLLNRPIDDPSAHFLSLASVLCLPKLLIVFMSVWEVFNGAGRDEMSNLMVCSCLSSSSWISFIVLTKLETFQHISGS